MTVLLVSKLDPHLRQDAEKEEPGRLYRGRIDLVDATNDNQYVISCCGDGLNSLFRRRVFAAQDEKDLYIERA